MKEAVLLIERQIMALRVRQTLQKEVITILQLQFFNILQKNFNLLKLYKYTLI